MAGRRVAFAVMALTYAACLTPALATELPPERIATYVIHEVPSDPNSAVTLTLNLSLQAQDAHELAVGWEITNIEFRAPSTTGAGDSVWTAARPELATSDGLWWVEHVDPLDPQVADFAQLPYLVGSALPTEVATQELLYDLEGSSYTIPYPYAIPYPITGGLDYAFVVDEDPDPVATGSNEPVEVPDEPQSPGSQG